jgi:hypothetical protein
MTFGWNFNQSLDKGTLPSGLQTLTFGSAFNQSPDKVTVPSGLQTLTFGWNFCLPAKHAAEATVTTRLLISLRVATPTRAPLVRSDQLLITWMYTLVGELTRKTKICGLTASTLRRRRDALLAALRVSGGATFEYIKGMPLGNLKFRG